MFIVFNLPGLGIAVLSFILYGLLDGIMPSITTGSGTFYFAGISFIVMDASLRLVLKKRFRHTKIGGGSLFYIPVYLIGAAFLIYALFSSF